MIKLPLILEDVTNWLTQCGVVGSSFSILPIVVRDMSPLTPL